MHPAPPDPEPPIRLLGVATQGAGGDDEARLKVLLSGLDATFFPFDRKRKRQSAHALFRTIRRERPDLVVLEGTGLAGGLAVLLGRLVAGAPYIVSSGDAVGPFVGAIAPLAGPAFALYERRLCRSSAGFIGWTPYLAGRALSFGSPRAMTAAGWAPFTLDPEAARRERERIRAALGIPAEALVVGIVGSLAWIERRGYAYGLELVRAMARVGRKDVHALIVGDGTGLDRLKAEAGPRLGTRIHLPGRVPRDQVPHYLAAMDLASLPQSVDKVGAFRYTTKLPEYLAAGLPIVTGEIPLAYDFDGGWLWRLPGRAPWDDRTIAALAALLDGLTPEALAEARARVPMSLPEFDRDRQVARVAAFLRERVAALRADAAR